MDFDGLRKDMKRFNFEALRTDCDNFFEGVIIQQELDKLHLQLKSFMGEPVFPSKNRLPHKVQETVDGLGGIMPGQTKKTLIKSNELLRIRKILETSLLLRIFTMVKLL